MWDGDGPNPYLGLLALSDRLVVTSDSVSMISEALATPRPVDVFDLDAGRRHRAFLERLIERRMVRRFTPEGPPQLRPDSANVTARIAETVRRMALERAVRRPNPRGI
jgi:hypothetical protein